MLSSVVNVEGGEKGKEEKIRFRKNLNLPLSFRGFVALLLLLLLLSPSHFQVAHSRMREKGGSIKKEAPFHLLPAPNRKSQMS